MRVLMIDDNPLDIEVISRMLQRGQQATVESVHTAEEGIRRLGVQEYDVVLVDYCLPGKNGIEFLAELAAHKLTTPVLLITARGDERMEETARQAGAAGYVSKDEALTPALTRAVVAAAERGRAQRAIRDRDRVEELWHTAEKRIQELEHRVGSLQANPSLGRKRAAALHGGLHGAEFRALVQRYREILVRFVGTQTEAQRAREQLGDFVIELMQHGFTAEHLVSLHTETLHLLRESHEELRSMNGCTPRMLLLEAALALLDAWRRAALTAST